MDFSDEIRRQRRALAESALTVAREIEAGRALTPFQERLTQLVGDAPLPVRAAVIAATPAALEALLGDVFGQDYNVCKVAVPSRLGYSEVLLQERGFLLDTGAGAREFDDSASFVAALQQNHALLATEDAGLEPLRLKLAGPAHLSGLCLLIPQSLEALVRKPALLSTLADQADWLFLAASSDTAFTAEERAAIQLVLDHVAGFQGVLAGDAASPSNPPAEWWRGWKVPLSLGVVRFGTELLRNRLALLTAPPSELRHYLVESRRLRQLEMTLSLMDEEIRQHQRQLTNRLTLSREGLTGPASATDGRKTAEAIRVRLAEESDSLLRAAERDAKTALAPDGELNRRLRAAAQRLSVDDLDQTDGETTIRLTLAPRVTEQLVAELATISRDRLTSALEQLREGLTCSVRDAEQALTAATTHRHPLAFDLPEETALSEAAAAVARPELRYRGEMPRPTLLTRFHAARQSIMGLMIAGTLLGGAASLTGESTAGGGNLRTTLYALMLPLLIIGFLWTYVSFRKKERLALEKEIEKLQDGVFAELRRVAQELLREQQAVLAGAIQKSVRQLHQQIDGVFDALEKQRQRDADDQRRRLADQQRTTEQRLGRLRQFGTQIATAQSRLADATKVQRQWLAAWITTFNQARS